jgi:hypothetical protein
MLFEKIELEQSEIILKIVRRHWFIIVSELFAILIAALLPFAGLATLAFLPDDMQFFSLGDTVTFQVVTFGISGWLLLCFMVGFMLWTNYYLDTWIVTDRRIIYIDQRSFFNRNVSMFRLERLQDIEIRTVGIIQTFLNFGTISAQTAGSLENNFISSGLPDPRGLQSTIQRAMDARLKMLNSRSHSDAV